MSETGQKTQASMIRLGAIVGAILVLGFLQYQFNIIPIRPSQQAAVPLSVDLVNQPTVSVDGGQVDQVGLPSTNPTKITGPTIRTSIWAWNAQMGLIYANGGPKTTIGSLMEKNGVRLNLVRQDDTSKSQAEQIKFAQALAKGDSNPGEGVHFVIIMGDGAAQYLAAINKATEKLGPDYRAEIIGAVGYSGNAISGEDCFMGPQEWRDNPEAAKGGLVAGVLRDGDWNLAAYWLQQNGIRNNPDETVFDPTALNWVATNDYLKAAELYISGYCEDRKVIKEGKVTSEKRKVCVQGAVTWTPGDVNIAKQKGGLVKLISTKENAYQMPSVVIGIHKWNQDHAKLVQSFLKATFDGSDQVRNFPNALNRAGQASYAVYAEESAAYWVKYYKGVVERDRTGMPVPLGGSRVANLGDNLVLFGLASGAGDLGSSVFKATYEGFGNISKQQYPKLVPEFPQTDQAVNLTFLQALAETNHVVPSFDKFDDTSGSITDVVGKRNWNIQFETGKATFTTQAETTLSDLYNQLVISKLSVEITGHTDNVGNPTSNQSLSEARAQAVEDYLVGKAPNLFKGKLQVAGKGQDEPLASNETLDGRAKNRRVTVTIGNK